MYCISFSVYSSVKYGSEEIAKKTKRTNEGVRALGVIKNGEIFWR